jgi:small-conductance mechanosensitive channel
MLENKPMEIIHFTVFLTDYSKNGTTITLEYFTPAFSMAEFNTLKQAINLELMQLMEKEKLELASAGSNINIFSADTEAAKSRPIL